jgi:DNA primase
MDRAELDAALKIIDVEAYLDREGVDYKTSYGTKGLQLNLDECPACGEGGRKTYIGAETGLGNCFHGSCNFKFNKFWLIKKVSGLGGPDLDTHIATVAQEQGWMPRKARAQIVQGVLKLPSKLHKLPINGCDNLQYLQDRGVTNASCTFFDLSYCHGGWWSYKLDDGTDKFVKYDQRVIIPIADLEGNLVSFQGRDVTSTLIPKYLFPVGFAVAGQHLYNGQNFIEGEHTHAIVGEGAFDAIAVHQALDGASSCAGMLPLATFGMHLSDGPDGQVAKFIRLKERGLKTVTFLWDGEGKATAYAVKMGLKLVGLGLAVRIGRLPPGFDPAQGPDGKPTPPALVRQAIFSATKLDRLSAIRLLHGATISI